MLPYFYIRDFDENISELQLDEDNSRHIVQVLRMQRGEKLLLTDGAGHLLTASILDDHKKKCRVKVEETLFRPAVINSVTIAISPLKNASRFEWFLEKATEIGVATIIPLLSERTERQQFREDRWRNILVSAMLQSQQSWLPRLSTPLKYAQLLSEAPSGYDRLFIAHCLEAPRPTSSLATLVSATGSIAPQVSTLSQNSATERSVDPSISGNPRSASEDSTTSGRTQSSLILIGPEGDFSPPEVTDALETGFIPVTLGVNRLRTETAGVVAASLLCIQ